MNENQSNYWDGKVSEPTLRICNLGLQWLPKDYDVLESFDAQKWAGAFLQTLREHPEIIIDHELMVTWFSNALMRGYDQHRWQTLEYKRSVRRCLFPWWNWKHWAVADRIHPKLLQVDCRM